MTFQELICISIETLMIERLPCKHGKNLQTAVDEGWRREVVVVAAGHCQQSQHEIKANQWCVILAATMSPITAHSRQGRSPHSPARR